MNPKEYGPKSAIAESAANMILREAPTMMAGNDNKSNGDRPKSLGSRPGNNSNLMGEEIDNEVILLVRQL